MWELHAYVAVGGVHQCDPRVWRSVAEDAEPVFILCGHDAVEGLVGSVFGSPQKGRCGISSQLLRGTSLEGLQLLSNKIAGR